MRWEGECQSVTEAKASSGAQGEEGEYRLFFKVLTRAVAIHIRLPNFDVQIPEHRMFCFIIYMRFREAHVEVQV